MYILQTKNRFLMAQGKMISEDANWIHLPRAIIGQSFRILASVVLKRLDKFHYHLSIKYQKEFIYRAFHFTSKFSHSLYLPDLTLQTMT